MRSLHSTFRFDTRNSSFPSGSTLGFSVTAACLLVAIAISGHWGRFFDLPAFFIVVGGTLGATLTQFSLEAVKSSFRVVGSVLRSTEPAPGERLRELVRLAQRAKTDGLLEVERYGQTVLDPLLRKGCQLVADGRSRDEIRHILAIDAQTALEPYKRSSRCFESMAGYAPALGLIGTLVGLIQMLGALDNPLATGQAMAVSLVTTLYGALLANTVLYPLAGKIQSFYQRLDTVHQLTIEGLASIAAAENSIVVEQRLSSFIRDAA